MKRAVSNIAWQSGDQDKAFALLARSGVQGIEIAPGLTFPSEQDPICPSGEAIDAFEAQLHRHGLGLVAMQSLLYGDPQAQLFGDDLQRERFEARMTAAIALAGRLAIPTLVFGSPTNRSLPSYIPAIQCEADAVSVFRHLGDACLLYGCRIGVEPVPKAYGTNFLNSLAEALAFVTRVDHFAIALTLDTGAMLDNAELDVTLAIIDEHLGLISHVQISAPGLKGFPSDTGSVQRVVDRLEERGYDGSVSIEMRAGAGSNLETLRDAIEASASIFVR